MATVDAEAGHKAMLYFLEILMNSNAPLTISQLAGRFGSKSFTSDMRTAAGGNEIGLRRFLQRFPSLFTVNGNLVSIHNTSAPGSSTDSGSLAMAKQKSIETQAVEYFRLKLGRKEEQWVPVISLAGHLSQASTDIRQFVGSQSDFKLFLTKYPSVFLVKDEKVCLRDHQAVSSPNSAMRAPRRLTTALDPSMVNQAAAALSTQQRPASLILFDSAYDRLMNDVNLVNGLVNSNSQQAQKEKSTSSSAKYESEAVTTTASGEGQPKSSLMSSVTSSNSVQIPAVPPPGFSQLHAAALLQNQYNVAHIQQATNQPQPRLQPTAGPLHYQSLNVPGLRSTTGVGAAPPSTAISSGAQNPNAPSLARHVNVGDAATAQQMHGNRFFMNGSLVGPPNDCASRLRSRSANREPNESSVASVGTAAPQPAVATKPSSFSQQQQALSQLNHLLRVSAASSGVVPGSRSMNSGFVRSPTTGMPRSRSIQDPISAAAAAAGLPSAAAAAGATILQQRSGEQSLYIPTQPYSYALGPSVAPTAATAFLPGSKECPLPMTTNEYRALMFIKGILERKGPTKLHNITGHFSQAPEGIRQTIGWSKYELEEFIKQHNILFKLGGDDGETVILNSNARLNVVITGTRPNIHAVRQLTGRRAKVFHIAKLWGIIDLGKHEHVFFDRSILPKYVDDLNKFFSVGETLAFNAVLAPKNSRAKWRATKVWKEDSLLPAPNASTNGASTQTLPNGVVAVGGADGAPSGSVGGTGAHGGDANTDDSDSSSQDGCVGIGGNLSLSNSIEEELRRLLPEPELDWDSTNDQLLLSELNSGIIGIGNGGGYSSDASSPLSSLDFNLSGCGAVESGGDAALNRNSLSSPHAFSQALSMLPDSYFLNLSSLQELGIVSPSSSTTPNSPTSGAVQSSLHPSSSNNVMKSGPARKQVFRGRPVVLRDAPIDQSDKSKSTPTPTPISSTSATITPSAVTPEHKSQVPSMGFCNKSDRSAVALRQIGAINKHLAASGSSQPSRFAETAVAATKRNSQLLNMDDTLPQGSSVICSSSDGRGDVEEEPICAVEGQGVGDHSVPPLLIASSSNSTCGGIATLASASDGSTDLHVLIDTSQPVAAVLTRASSSLIPPLRTSSSSKQGAFSSTSSRDTESSYCSNSRSAHLCNGDTPSTPATITPGSSAARNGAGESRGPFKFPNDDARHELHNTFSSDAVASSLDSDPASVDVVIRVKSDSDVSKPIERNSSLVDQSCQTLVTGDILATRLYQVDGGGLS